MAEKKSDAGAQRQPPEIQIDDSKAETHYANIFRVTGTPEELVVDFGFNAGSIEQINGPIAVSQRLVMSFYTAKRLFQLLGVTLQRHEQTFGPIETNVQKRVVPPPQPRPNS